MGMKFSALEGMEVKPILEVLKNAPIDILKNITIDSSFQLDPVANLKLLENLQINPDFRIEFAPSLVLGDLRVFERLCALCLFGALSCISFFAYLTNIASPKAAGAFVAVGVGALVLFWSSQPDSEPEAPQSPLAEPKECIFVGNPGCGKTTIMNGLCGKVLFEAEVSSDGLGVSKELNTMTIPGMGKVTDTPGLNDPRLCRRQSAAIKIKEALEQTGMPVSIFFVLELVAGRIQRSDVVTMDLVLDAIMNVDLVANYSIIINKVSAQNLKLWAEKGIEPFVDNLLMDVRYRTNRIIIVPENRAITTSLVPDAEFKLDPKLWNFIATAPTIQVTEVVDVNINEWDKKMNEITKAHEIEILRFKAENTKLEAKYKAQLKARDEEDRQRADRDKTPGKLLEQVKFHGDLHKTLRANKNFVHDAFSAGWRAMGCPSVNWFYFKDKNCTYSGDWEVKEEAGYIFGCQWKWKSAGSTLHATGGRGYENWGFAGSWKQDNNFVTFSGGL